MKEYVASGDVFQCVLSQRFDCEPGVDAFAVYRALRIVNPSPYMYFLRFGLEGGGGGGGEKQILRFAKDDKQKGEGRQPENEGSEWRFADGAYCGVFAGAAGAGEWAAGGVSADCGDARRSADEAEDLRMETELRGDEKELAEHIMLVDLGRNDVGRVSEFGSVKVKDLMFVERYCHVMHLVSALEGTLKKGLEAIDAFRSCFPAGTLSGAPKIRAMEVIEELEPARRGVYGGSILYADFSGNLDSCIAIRTLYLDGEKGYIQAGAGIVADSVPESEFEECRNKAQAVVRAIERAREM